MEEITHELSQLREEIEKYKSMDEEKCLELLEDLWRRKKEVSSPKNEAILYLQSELAHFNFRLNKFRESQALFNDLWLKQKEILGIDNIKTLQTEFSIGMTYLNQWRLTEALDIFQKLLEKQRRVLGDEARDTLQTEGNIGVIYLNQRKFTEALDIFQKLLEKQRRVLGDEARNTLQTEGNIGVIHLNQRKFTEALDIFQKLLEKQRRVFGDEARSTLQAEFSIGVIYLNQEKLTEALEVFQKLLEKQRRVLGDEARDTLQTEFSIGTIYLNQQRFTEALDIFQKLLEKQHRVLGDEDRDTLQTEDNIGAIYQNQQKFTEALDIFQKLLEKQRRVLGDEARDTLQTEFNIGAIYLNQQKSTEALEVFQKLLEKQRPVLGDEARSTLQTESNIGAIYLNQQKFTEALDIFQKLLEKQRRVLGDDDRDTLQTEGNIGVIHRNQQKFTEALDIFRKLLEKQRCVLGDDDRDTLQTEDNIGVIYVYQQKFTEALDIFQKLLEKQRRVLGDDDRSTLQTEDNIGAIYVYQQKLTEALDIFQKLLEKQRRVLGDDDRSTLQTEFNIGMTYVYQQKFTEALDIFQKLLEKQRRVLGDDDRSTLQTEFSIGTICVSQQKFTEALDIFQKLLEKQRRVLGDDDRSTLQTEFSIGMTYINQQEFTEALDIFRKLLEKQRRVLGDDDRSTLQTEFNIGMTYINQQEFTEALDIFQKLLEKQRRVLGDEDSNTLQTEFNIGVTHMNQRSFTEALDIFQKLLKKQRRVLEINNPITTQTQLYIDQIREYTLHVEAEDKKHTSIPHSKGTKISQSVADSELQKSDSLKISNRIYELESVPERMNDETNIFQNSNLTVPDYRLISKHSPYGFHPNRSIEYSELTGAPIVTSPYASISNDSKGDAEKSFEHFSLQVRNFLNLREIDLKLTPVMCIYGSNQVGKSNLSRLLYGFQDSCAEITEELKRERYSKNIVSLTDKLLLLKSHLLGNKQRFKIPEEVSNLLFDRLRILIRKQVSGIPLYFNPSQKNWKNLIGSFDNDAVCQITSSRSFFECKVKIKGRNIKQTDIEIDLKPKKSFGIEIEFVTDPNIVDRMDLSLFEKLYGLRSLKVHFADRLTISIPLRTIDLRDNLEHLPVLHHVIYFSGIPHLSDQKFGSSEYRQDISKIINNPEIVSKESLDILDNRLVYLIYDTLLIELWKMSPFSFFVGGARSFPAERGGILEKIPIYDVNNLMQEHNFPKGLQQYCSLIGESLFFTEEKKMEARRKMPSRDRAFLKEMEMDLIAMLSGLKVKVIQDKMGVPEHIFVRKSMDEEKIEQEFSSDILPSSVFSLFALDLHVRLSKLKVMLLYEEPETHLHPKTIEKLCEILVKIYHHVQPGTEHNLVMLFTSHSQFFLDFLLLSLERVYKLDKMQQIYSLVHLETDERGYTRSKRIETTREGYEESPYEEEERKIHNELIDMYNEYED